MSSLPAPGFAPSNKKSWTNDAPVKVNGTSVHVGASKVGPRHGSPEIEPTGGQATDVGELMDAMGTSGVDIAAEEEALRLVHERNAALATLGPQVDRSRKQDFIDPSVLAECVKKIAGAFALKTLEPDTIPFIALAVRHRLMSLINESIAARDHRVMATHLRAPPLVGAKRKRRADDDSDEEVEAEVEESEEESDEDDGDDLLGGGAKKKKKVPAWDHLVLDDAEKILNVLERVDREEERRRRRERMIRDEREREAQELADAMAAEAEEDEETTGRVTKGGAPSTPGPASRTASPGPDGTSTPKLSKAKAKSKALADGGTETPKPKEKKKKKDTPAVTARNLSEDVRKRLSDQTAMRSAGGRTFSWLNPGASSSSNFGTPTPASTFLAKPMFAPQPGSSLPPPTFGIPSRASSSLLQSTTLSQFNKSSLASSSTLPGTSSQHPLSRLANVPALHDASRAFEAKELWERRKKEVELGDIVWALERERGMGAAKGDRILRKSWATMGKGL